MQLRPLERHTPLLWPVFCRLQCLFPKAQLRRRTHVEQTRAHPWSQNHATTADADAVRGSTAETCLRAGAPCREVPAAASGGLAATSHARLIAADCRTALQPRT